MKTLLIQKIWILIIKITLLASGARSRNVLLSQIRLVARRRIIFLFNKGHRHKARWKTRKSIISRKIKRINRKCLRGKTLKEDRRKLSLLKVMPLLEAVDID